MNTGRANRTRPVTSIETGAITRLLHAAGAGDHAAWGRLVDLVYPEMNRFVSSGPADAQTTGVTSLMHECYVRLSQASTAPRGNDHLLALAVRIMRQVLVDHARERLAAASVNHPTVTPVDPTDERKFRQLTGIDDALHSLAAHQPRQAQVFECRYFGGLGDDETATALSLSVLTVRRDWNAARAWLGHALNAVHRSH